MRDIFSSIFPWPLPPPPPPPPLSFSVEISLPHLPGRTPFVAVTPGVARTRASTSWDVVQRSTQGHCKIHAPSTEEETTTAKETAALLIPGRCAVCTKELIARLEGLPSSSSASPQRLVQERWLQFTRLCDSLVRFAMCPSSSDTAADTTSTRARAPRHSFVGVVLPCKEVYWCARDVEGAAATRKAAIAPASSSCGFSPSTEVLSTAQAAVFLFHHHWRVPVTLVLNTTVPNYDPDTVTPTAAEEECGATPRSRVECDTLPAAATPGGIDAVVADFVAWGGSRLFLVRGDTPPDPPLSLRGDIPTGPPLSRALGGSIAATDVPPWRPHRLFQTAGDLVHHVSAVREGHRQEANVGSHRTGATALELCVAGYPQGHPFDRTWDVEAQTPNPASDEATATADAVEDVSGSAILRQRSFEFLRAFEEGFDAAERTFGTAVCIVKREGCSVSVEKSPSGTSADDDVPFVAAEECRDAAQRSCSAHFDMPELKELCRTIGRLDGVRRLWTSFSSYESDVRAACIRQMLEEKVLLSSPGKRDHRCSARRSCQVDVETPVIVTQMITSATEFTDYVAEVHRGLRAWNATVPDGHQQQQQRQPPTAATLTAFAPISIIPGVLLPHPTNVHVLLRSLYYSKVIPSARMQHALEAYASELTSAWLQLARAHPPKKKQLVLKDDTPFYALAASDVSAVKLEINETCVAQVEAHVAQVRRGATRRFTTAWLSETADLLHELCHHGHTRVHLFTMFNDQVDERVRQLLAAYDAPRGESTKQ
ncbi:hypothetical protein JKF63_07637 [Porcisia hertigi]|uniref:Uncharacterized protein n=1 Tax=Porcisia hertigi TaxID=2761500 RepID=A0A836IIN2_9TRYP|nr:hypothetical protein JKF63_07637 [Porcisia hertigi]